MARQRRPNPARSLEVFASEVVQRWVGDRGVVNDLGGSHGADFRIDYNDGRVGVGEVGWHQDQRTQEMWALILDQDQHQVVDLPPGFGQWSVGFERIPRIKTLRADVSELIAAMISEGREQLTMGYFEHGEVAELARRFGVDNVRWIADTPDRAFFSPPHRPATWVVEDPETLPAWLEQVLADPRYADTTAKLLPVPADERHVFLMTGLADDFAILDAIHRIASTEPGRPPDLPVGITHAWAVAQFGGEHAALWSVTNGWDAVPLPPPPDLPREM